MMVSVMPSAAAEATIGNSEPRISVRNSTNEKIEIPHNMYPPQINSFRLPTRSDSDPIKMVVTVADTADAATISEIADADA